MFGSLLQWSFAVTGEDNRANEAELDATGMRLTNQRLENNCVNDGTVTCTSSQGQL